MYSINRSGKGDKPPLQSKRLLDQVKERIRYLPYGLSTEHAYVFWVRRLMHWSGIRHPKGMGATEVTEFF
jgi:hypothetical protein